MRRQIVACALSWMLAASPGFAADSAPATAASSPAGPKLGGYVQAGETFQDGPGLTGTINRARVFIQGGVKPAFTYRVAVEFAAASGTSAVAELARRLHPVDARVVHRHRGSMQDAVQPRVHHVLGGSRGRGSLVRRRLAGHQARHRRHGRGGESVGDALARCLHGEGQNVVVNRDSRSS
jgi:hypothetical protein